ncbi:hypothetical protein GCM10010116_49340 [Microbispora rosea subsp. aerata]|nr:hypothetical protein [Microbispora rosea]GGO24523.1 hypothetical protein GCM10010116_49340 [Microbispora rosea subsp. aerata]
MADSRPAKAAASTGDAAPSLDIWVSNPQDSEARIEVQVANKPGRRSPGQRPIWSGEATAEPGGSSRITLSMPKGKLTPGSKARWRARTVADGVAGEWTSWQEFTAGDPVSGKKTDDRADRPSTTANQPLLAQAASRKFPYNRMAHEECQQAVANPNRPAYEIAWDKNLRGFRHKNSYNTCFAMWVGERDEDDDIDRDIELFSVTKWVARVTIVFHTYVGKYRNTQPRDKAGFSRATNSRQISAWIRVDRVQMIDDDWEDRKFAIFLGENGDTNCSSTYRDSSGAIKSARYGISDTVANWRNGGDREILLDVPENPNHLDKAATCSVNPAIRYEYNPDLSDKLRYFSPFFSDPKRTVAFICDSAQYITAYQGGCVIGSIRPVFILDGNDPKVDESADHWYAALYHPDLTYPRKLSGSKVIPGRLNWSNLGCTGPGNVTCLHRTRSQSVIDQNRNDYAIPTCRMQKSGYKSPDSCDEFPFASTIQGAAHPTFDFSTNIINVRDNCASGSRTRVFYDRHRVRDNMAFWVDVIRPGKSIPESGAPGVVVQELLPEELPIVCAPEDMG